MKYQDVLFIAATSAVVIAGNQIQHLGAVGYILFILLFAASAGVSMLERDKWPLWLFTAWGTTYVIFSYLHRFPPAWTVYFEKGVIPQQGAFVFAIWPIVSASQRFWRGQRSPALITLTSIAILASFAIGCGLDMALDRGFTLARVAATLKNDSAIVLFVITFYMFSKKNVPMHGVFALMTLYVGVLQSYLQTLLTYVYAWFLRVLNLSRFRISRLVLVGVLASALIGTLYGLAHIETVWLLDKNTGWRLLFWHGTLEALQQTRGIGVGFGTEALQNFYREIPHDVFLADDTSDFLLVGTHKRVFRRRLAVGHCGTCPYLAHRLSVFPGKRDQARASLARERGFLHDFYLHVSERRPAEPHLRDRHVLSLRLSPGSQLRGGKVACQAQGKNASPSGRTCRASAAGSPSP